MSVYFFFLTTVLKRGFEKGFWRVLAETRMVPGFQQLWRKGFLDDITTNAQNGATGRKAEQIKINSKLVLQTVSSTLYIGSIGNQKFGSLFLEHRTPLLGKKSQLQILERPKITE